MGNMCKKRGKLWDLPEMRNGNVVLVPLVLLLHTWSLVKAFQRLPSVLTACPWVHMGSNLHTHMHTCAHICMHAQRHAHMFTHTHSHTFGSSTESRNPITTLTPTTTPTTIYWAFQNLLTFLGGFNFRRIWLERENARLYFARPGNP